MNGIAPVSLFNWIPLKLSSSVDNKNEVVNMWNLILFIHSFIHFIELQSAFLSCNKVKTKDVQAFNLKEVYCNANLMVGHLFSLLFEWKPLNEWTLKNRKMCVAKFIVVHFTFIDKGEG